MTPFRIPGAFTRTAFSTAAAALCAVLLASCGGGGGDGGGSSGGGGGGGTSTNLPSSTSLAEQCAAPRPAGTIDPISGNPYNDKQGSLDTEKAWLRSWIDETYLWYRDVEALPAATLDRTNYSTPLAYFDALKTPLLDSQGQAKDKFHFTYDTPTWDNLSLAGVSYGYDFEITLQSASPPRVAIVAYTDDGAATGQQGIGRGASIITVDGVDLANGSDVDTLNAGLFPTAAGPHTLVVKDLGSSTNRTVTVNATPVTESPVQNVKTLATTSGTVGYFLFNDHIATAESQLIAAINQLKTANVSDLVLDMRYNGGGYLDIASELAYMIAGPNNTNGKFFERETYNDKNPFGFTTAQDTTDFHATSQGFSTASGAALPTLNLNRVYVLTSASTCSASEAVVNGLRGAGVNVYLIGDTTCGKPYGFFPTDNCGTTYFSIMFQGVNNLGFGDYPDGFTPTCTADDDFTHALGDPLENQLNVALGYRANATCAALVGSASRSVASATRLNPLARPVLVRNAFRENRILRKPVKTETTPS